MKDTEGRHRRSMSVRVTRALRELVDAVLPGVANKSSVALHLLWTVSYVASFVALFLFMLPLYRMYDDQYTNTVLSVSTEDRRVFPTIAFCHKNIVRKSKLSQLPQFAPLGNLELMEMFQLHFDIHPRETCRIKEEAMFAELRFLECDQFPDTCIPKSWVCDGKEDCPLGTEEVNCTVDEDNILFHATIDADCDYDSFQCGSYCLPGVDEMCDNEFYRGVCTTDFELFCDYNEQYSAPQVTYVFEYVDFVIPYYPPGISTEEPTTTTEDPFPPQIYSTNAFTRVYENNEDVETRITIPRDRFANVTFLQFALEPKKFGECKDYLVVMDRVGNWWKDCGVKSVPFSLLFATDVIIRFVSDSTVVNAGALLTIDSFPCEEAWCQYDLDREWCEGDPNKVWCEAGVSTLGPAASDQIETPHCISSSLRCDLIDHCLDGSDESDCYEGGDRCEQVAELAPPNNESPLLGLVQSLEECAELVLGFNQSAAGAAVTNPKLFGPGGMAPLLECFALSSQNRTANHSVLNCALQFHPSSEAASCAYTRQGEGLGFEGVDIGLFPSLEECATSVNLASGMTGINLEVTGQPPFRCWGVVPQRTVVTSPVLSCLLTDKNVLDTIEFQGLWRLAVEESQRPNFADVEFLRRSFTEDLLRNYGHQLTDTIVDVIFDEVQLDIQRNFLETTHNIHGNCYVFNSGHDGEGLRQTSKVGTEHGLSATFFLEAAETSTLFTSSPGVSMFVSSADSQLSFASDPLFLRPGYISTVGLQLFQMYRREDKKGHCVSEWPWFVPRMRRQDRYNQQTCHDDCFNHLLKTECHCQEQFDDVEGIRQCNPWLVDDRVCRANVSRLAADSSGLCITHCGNPCFEEGYQYTTTYEEWPSTDQVAFLVRRFLKSEARDSAFGSFLNDEILPSIASSVLTRPVFEQIRDRLRENLVQVNVNYRDLNMQIVTEVPAYSAFDLIADFGGNLGLCLGWSFLMGVTIVEHCGKLLASFFARGKVGGGGVDERLQKMSSVRAVSMFPVNGFGHGKLDEENSRPGSSEPDAAVGALPSKSEAQF